MARKKKSPLYASILDDNIIVEPGPKDTKNTTIGEDGTITYKDTKNTDGGSILGGEDIMEAYRDKVHSLDATAVSPGPKEIDTSGIDKQIATAETPIGTSVFDKQAAYYRQQGEAQVLRNQKDFAALTQPTITLYGERIAASNAKYELLKEQMPEFDSSNIFGEEGPNKIAMPIVGEIKNISKSVKADMRELSRLNINDPRYDELRNKMEKDQQLIVEFDNINQQLIKIRNDKESNGSESDNWSKQMGSKEQRMWQDIYTGNGENIKIINGKLMWLDPLAGLDGTEKQRKEAISDIMSSTELGKTTNVIEGLSEHFEGDGSGIYENLNSQAGVSLENGETIVSSDALFKIFPQLEEDFKYPDEEDQYNPAFYADKFKVDENGNVFFWGARWEDYGDPNNPSHKPEFNDNRTYGWSKFITDSDEAEEWYRRDDIWEEGAEGKLTDAERNVAFVDKEDLKLIKGLKKYANQTTKKRNVKENVKERQRFLINSGYLDEKNAGGSSAIDGNFGENSEDAEKRYLKDRDKLLKESKETYTDTEEYKSREVDSKDYIDLSKIGDEPTLRSAKAQKASFSMQNFMYNAIQNGANAKGNAAAKSLYNEALGDVEFMYDDLNTREQASLLFDGMDEKDTRSVNTNSFVNSILEENDMELSDLIEGGMLESYTDPETGKEMPLRQMFKNWYLDELYEKTKPLTPTNIAGGGSGSGSGSSSGSSLTNSGVNITYGVRGSAEVSYGNKTINGYDLQDGEIGITGVDLKSIVKKITATDGSSLKEHTSEVEDDKNYIITEGDILMKYDEDTETWVPSDFNKDSSNPKSVDTYNAIMTDIKKKIEKEGGTFNFVKGTSFSHVKSRKDQADLDDFDFSESLYTSDGTNKNIIDLHMGNGETLADDFNKKYEKYGFYAVVNDDNPNLKLSPDVMAGTFASERDGEGVLENQMREQY